MQAFLIKILLNLMKSWKRFYFDFSQFGEEKVIFNKKITFSILDSAIHCANCFDVINSAVTYAFPARIPDTCIFA